MLRGGARDATDPRTVLLRGDMDALPVTEELDVPYRVVNVAAGDIIMTGTPAGVAAVQPGDKLECGIDGVGTLKVSIGK